MSNDSIEVDSLATADWHRQLGGARKLLAYDLPLLEQAFRQARTVEEKLYLLAVLEMRAAYSSLNADPSMGQYRQAPDVPRGYSFFISTNMEQGKFLAQITGDLFEGVFAPWKYRSGWAYSELAVETLVMDVCVSPAGVVHINENPFSPFKRQTNVTLKATAASMDAVLKGTAVDVRQRGTAEA